MSLSNTDTVEDKIDDGTKKPEDESVNNYFSESGASSVQDRPELYDPKIPLLFERNLIRFPYQPFEKLNSETQKVIIDQLCDLRKNKENGIFVPEVGEYTNPFVFLSCNYLIYVANNL